jgi:hypothetical protein
MGRMSLYALKTRILFFFKRNAIVLRRIYLTCVTLLCVVLFAVPITLSIINPHVRLPDVHGPPPTEMLQAYNLALTQHRRKMGRIHEFSLILHHMVENYPFFETAEKRTGIDYFVLYANAFEDLQEEAEHDVSPRFLPNFANERFISYFDGIGSLQITMEARLAFDWLIHPYFFGFYDWRLTDERFDIPVREENFVTADLGEGIAYMRVHSFLPVGYEPITFEPFRYFHFDTEKQHLWDFYGGLYDFEHLVIDIRGINDGFGDYFLPLLLAPHINEATEARFYGFHTGGHFARRVSGAFRDWYGLPEPVDADLLTENFVYALPENLLYGFPVYLTAQPDGNTRFDGQIWLLTDSGSFCGANLMYLQMAYDAGFTIIYEENPQAQGTGWATSFVRLPHSGASLRFNPLYFTDREGRALEADGAFYHIRLTDISEGLEEILEAVTGRE